MADVTAVICDFGGVMTTPLADAFAELSDGAGISLEQLGGALAAVAVARGAHPLHELERGELSEAEFVTALAAELELLAGRTVDIAGLGGALFAGLHPNECFIAYLRRLHARGVSLAVCTNNVREWSTRWRAMVPVEELFEVVVDSSEVGYRKPDPEIYEITLRELGVAPAAAVLVDDLEENCVGAELVGLRAVRFHDSAQAIAELETILGATA